MVVQKSHPVQSEINAAIVKSVEGIRNLRSTVKNIGFGLDRDLLQKDGWLFDTPEVIDLFRKIESHELTISDYLGEEEIFYGIKTGRNKAFVIDESTRDVIVRKDKGAEEIIKPWLRGKDLKKWKAAPAGLYVINIQSSTNKEWPWTGKTNEKAEKIFEDTFPAVYEHLQPHRERLKKRYDQGNYYWELRACSYNDKFEETKIIYPDISIHMKACFDTEGRFCGNTIYFLPSDSLFLVGLLNSTLFDWYARNKFQALGDPWKGGRLRFFTQYMKEVPIPLGSKGLKSKIEEAISRILNKMSQGLNSDISSLEEKVNHYIYELYNISSEDAKVINDSYKN